MRLLLPTKRLSNNDKPMLWLVVLDENKKEVVTNYGFDISKGSGKPEIRGSNYPCPYDVNGIWWLIADNLAMFEEKWNAPTADIFSFEVNDAE